MAVWNKQGIRQARLDRALKVKEAAERLKVTPEYLSMVENGHRSPSAKLVGRMAEIYERPVADFLAPQNFLSIE